MAEHVVIIDYGSGNLHSALKAFQRAAKGHGIEVLVSSDPEHVLAADRVVLPGVGAFGDCLAGLNAVPGMREAIATVVEKLARPFMGICVGMQLFAERGLERGEHRGLGWISGDVVAIEPDDSALKVPHMGWNQLVQQTEHPVLAGLDEKAYVYFVHSFHMVPRDQSVILATAEYGGPLTAMVGRDTIVGTQFHPEKSQKVGLRLIENFLKWRP